VRWTVEVWRLDEKNRSGWHAVGTATTEDGLDRVGRRAWDPKRWGGFRHPDVGPRYGSLRAVADDGGIWVWTGDQFSSPEIGALVDRQVEPSTGRSDPG